MATFERQYTSGHLFSSKKITRSFRYQSKIPENRRDEDIQCVQTSIGAYTLNIPPFHAFPKPPPFEGKQCSACPKEPLHTTLQQLSFQTERVTRTGARIPEPCPQPSEASRFRLRGAQANKPNNYREQSRARATNTAVSKRIGN